MTRPRAQQIDDLQLRFSRHTVPFHTGPVWNLTGGQYNGFLNDTVSQIVDGAALDVGAYLTGLNNEPFFGAGTGNQFSITMPNVNSGNPIVVTIQAGDFVTLSSISVLTASRIAARINATLAGFGVTVNAASNNNGRLQIRSAHGSNFTTGDDAFVTITDVTPGIVQILGYGLVTTATATGFSGPRRGINSNTPDGRGGTVQARYSPREQILLTAPLQMLSTGFRTLVPNIGPAQPVYARLRWSPQKPYDPHQAYTPTWQLSWFTTGPVPASITTTQSNFTSLGPGDVLRIVVADPDTSYSVTVDTAFGTITSVQDVINAINQSWHNATDGFGTGAGRAIVTSNVPEPYNFTNTSNFQLILNNNAPIVINLGPETTAEDVAATVTAAIAAASQAAQGTCSAVTINGQKFVEIRSTSIDGTVSSVILQLNPNQNLSALNTLGIIPGEYHGSVLATLYGGAEITLSGLYRNPDLTSTISVSNLSGTPLAKMGLTAGVYSNSVGEEPATPPSNDFDTGLDILIPEVMEFGEVPANEEKTSEDFFSNRQEIPANPNDGIQNIGRFAGLNNQGKIPAGVLEIFQRFIQAASIQLGADVTPSAVALAPRILTPHSVSSGQYTLIWESIAIPAPAIPTDVAFRLYTDDSGRMIFTVNAKWNGTAYAKDVASLAATKLSLAPGNDSGSQHFMDVATRGRLSAGTWNESNWDQHAVRLSVFDVADTEWSAELGSKTALACLTGPLLFRDQNTVDPVQLTNSVGSDNAENLHVLDNADPDPTPTLFKRVNAKWTVTCGDGNISFGDFNGVNAIQQAIAFWNSSTPFNHIRIQVKSGIYNINTGVGAISIADGKGVVIEGMHRDGVVINVTDGVTPAIQFGTGVSGANVWLKNLTISHAGPPFARVDVNKNVILVAEDVLFSGTVLQITDGGAYNLIRCVFNTGNASADKPCITMTMGNGLVHGPFKALDCTFNVGQNQPALKLVSASAVVPLTLIGDIEYERCSFNLMSTTGVGGNLVGNCGVIDVDPAGSDATALTGVAVSRLLYRNCQVVANVNGGINSILIHLQPQTNGQNAGTGYLAVHRLEIEGGRWFCTAVPTFFNPFTISDVGGADLIQPGSYGDGQGGVFIRNVTMGFDRGAPGATVSGTMTADSKLWWLGAVGDVINANAWSAFAINAFHIEMNGVQFQGCPQLGASGDLIVRWSELVMKDVSIRDYVLGGIGGQPFHRLRLRPRVASGVPNVFYANIDGLRMTGTTASTGDWAQSAIVILEPWDSTLFSPSPLAGINIINSVIQLYRQPGFAPAQTQAWGFLIPSVATGSLYTGSSNFASNLTIENCHVSEARVGMGFNMFVADSAVSQIRFLNNHIIDCSNSGIAAASAGIGNWFNVSINGNLITNCGQFFNVPGIYMSLVGSGDSAPFEILDNLCYGNNTSTVQIQFEIPAGGIANNKPHGLIMGNDVRNGNTGGHIKVNQLDAGSLQVALTTPSSVSTLGLRGCETGYSITVIGDRVFTSGNAMLHNIATLETP